MTLATGTMFGPYEVVSALGARVAIGVTLVEASTERVLRTREYDREMKRAGGWPGVLRENLTWTYLRLGENDRAFAELEIVYREHGSWLWFLGHPVFDPVRADPRFQGLRRRINLPAAAR
jgi:hypothetical protein